MSKYGVFSGPYFPVFSPNTGKYGPEKTAYLDTFHAVCKVACKKLRPKFLCYIWTRYIEIQSTDKCLADVKCSSVHITEIEHTENGHMSLIERFVYV